MVYKWKEGSRLKSNPAVAAVVLTKLAEKNVLTAEKLVEVSKPVDAPLHDEFDWNNDTAAEKWRNHQARNIINALVIVPDEEMKISEPVRAFFQLESTSKEYTELRTIMKRPDQREMLLKQALSELSAFRRKYDVLNELNVIMQQIETTLKNYKEVI